MGWFNDWVMLPLMSVALALNIWLIFHNWRLTRVLERLCTIHMDIALMAWRTRRWPHRVIATALQAWEEERRR